MNSESPHVASWTFNLPRFVLPVLFAAALIVSFTAFSVNLSATSSSITLPIEVYSPDGTSGVVERITVEVLGADGVDSLYVEAHQPSYNIGGWESGPYEGFDTEGAASIRINGDTGGQWVDVRDENVDCAWPESQLNCIAGSYSTVRFTIPAENVVEGANTIDFRFNGNTDNVRSGYRVLNFGFMTSADPSVQMFGWEQHPTKPGARIRAINAHGAGTTPKKWFDPSTWSAPSGYDDASSVDEGRTLFQAENTLVDFRGNDLRASCGSCHAGNGRDLQYFNFSNKTIVSRSVAHGLTEDQGKKIAAFVRSIPIKRVSDGGKITPPGTPWDPPYQPGFGYGPDKNASPDEVDPVYWAAGAGLGWVFENDSETLPYVFPRNGDASQGLATTSSGLDWSLVRLDATDTNGHDKELNMREIPVSIQFPDWNNWVPDLHPMDYIPSKWNGSNYVVDHLNTTLPQAMQSGDLQEVDKAIRKFNGYFQRDGFHKLDRPNGVSENLHKQGELSMYQWKIVKVWEMQHTYEYEDKTDEMYCSDDMAPYCEPRGWPSRARHAFDVSPHITGSSLTSPPLVYGSVANDNYMAHVWYQLGVTVNPGTDPKSSGQNPVDWGYQEAFIDDMSKFNGDIGVSVRQFASEIKNWQQHSNGYRADGSGGNGFDEVGFRRAWSPAQSDLDRLFALPADGITTAERDMLVEAGLRAWHDYNGSIPTEDFPRTATKDRKRYMDSDYVPDLNEWTGNVDWPQKIYQGIHHVDQTMPGVSKGILDSLALWGDDMWPDDVEDYPGQSTKSWPSDQPTWNQLADYTPPSDGSQIIDLGQGWNIISSSTIPDDASMESVFGSLGSSVVLVKNENGDSYIPEFNINTIGNWKKDEAYKVYVTSSQSLTISGSSLDPTSSIPLDAGWNLVPYYPDTSMPAEDAFASLGSDLVIVKDFAGNAYLPDFGTNSLHGGSGEVRPGQGYQVYVTSDVDLTYPDPSTNQLRLASQTSSFSSGNTPGVASSSTLLVETPSLNDGAQLVAQTRDGLRVGAGTVDGNRALVRIWGDDPQTNAVDGATSGSSLTLRLASAPEDELELTDVRDVLGSAPARGLTFEQDAVLIASLEAGPTEMNLERNYPNPVRASTTIEYSIPEQSPVRLSVYDVLGRRVAVLVDESKSPGEYSVSFDASELSSGPYFYRLEASGSVVSRKMVVIR